MMKLEGPAMLAWGLGCCLWAMVMMVACVNAAGAEMAAKDRITFQMAIDLQREVSGGGMAGDCPARGG